MCHHYCYCFFCCYNQLVCQWYDLSKILSPWILTYNIILSCGFHHIKIREINVGNCLILNFIYCCRYQTDAWRRWKLLWTAMFKVCSRLKATFCPDIFSCKGNTIFRFANVILLHYTSRKETKIKVIPSFIFLGFSKDQL